jgi:hypothetical protein
MMIAIPTASHRIVVAVSAALLLLVRATFCCT